MTHRMGIALAALVNALVALYLHLWKIGLAGKLTCASGGGCEIAQFSSYGTFLGLDVALIGAVGWAIVFVVALVGTFPRHEDAPWPTQLLFGLAAFALLFTTRLKYGEWIVLQVFCVWCALNVVVTLLVSVLVALDWRRLGRLRAEGHGGLPARA